MPNNAQIKKRKEYFVFLEGHIGHQLIVKINGANRSGKLVRVSTDDPTLRSYIGAKVWLDEGDEFLEPYWADQIIHCSCQYKEPPK